MQPNERCWRGIAGFNGFLAIVMGAVAAHAIKDVTLAALAEKASLYQLIHAVVLVWLSDKQDKGFALTRWIFLTAIILFCGALYLKALTGLAAVTALAPLGGISFMVGWLLIALVSCKEK